MKKAAAPVTEQCPVGHVYANESAMGSRNRPSDTIAVTEHQPTEHSAQTAYHQSKFHPAFYNLKQDPAALAAMANYHNPGIFVILML